MQSPGSQRLNKPVGGSPFCPFPKKPMGRVTREAASSLFRTTLRNLAGQRRTGSLNTKAQQQWGMKL